MLSDLRSRIPFNETGIAPSLRPDLLSITKNDRATALVLDYLIMSASLDIENRKYEQLSHFVGEDNDCLGEPAQIKYAMRDVLEESEISQSLLELKELGFVTPNSLFTVRVNLQTIRNRLNGMR